MPRLGKKVFISYRGDYASYASALGRWLIENGYCKDAILFPPNSLSSKNELLLPYEYIELMEFILDHLARSDAFIFLNSPDYAGSYFTQAELLQWQRFKDDPVIYPAGMDQRGQFVIGPAQRLATLPKSAKKMWASISVGIARSYKSKSNPGLPCGKYAKNCFLVPCRNCGGHFLATQKVVYAVLKNQVRIACPHCQVSNFHFSEADKMGNFYRKPITLKQEIKAHLRILESNEILSLLFAKDPLPTIPLVHLEGESLSSDLAKMGKFYLALGALALGAISLAALLSEEDDE